MRNKLIMFSFLVVVIGIASFGIVHKRKVIKVDDSVIRFNSSVLSKKLQNLGLFYTVSGAYARPVKRSILHKSRTLNDFIEGYPVNWISAYISVEISSIDKGVEEKLVSENAILSIEQIAMLANLDIGAEVIVKVKYNTKDIITEVLEVNEMNVSLTVIPEVEAKYSGGYEKMITYLKKNSIDCVVALSNKGPKSLELKFLINEYGKAVDIKLIKKSGKIEVNNLLIELLENMPKWEAAKNLKTKNVSQQFNFRISSSNGC